VDKFCCSCKKRKDVEEFNIDNTRNDGYQSSCRECSNGIGRKHYLKYKEQYLARSKARRKNGRDFIREIKENVGCYFCEESRSACLDFHHEGYEQKCFVVSEILNYNRDKLINEIKKCIVVCANCHRIIHSEDK